ncbi:MAG: glycosyltransferase family 2 protein [Aestuariivirga sp.]
MKLTVGVVSRNGLPFLMRCLESLPSLNDCATDVEFILVDSASSDRTLDAMLAFARARSNCRVYSMQGKVNLSATRNVVLRNASPGAVFLVDGDVAVNRDFVVAALEELKLDTCDIVTGRYTYILHDGKGKPYSTIPDVNKINTRHYLNHAFGGIIPYNSGIVLLGPQVMEKRPIQDESMRRSQDYDFLIRLADDFRILGLPINMGTHFTVPYLHPDRIGTWFKEAYNRPAARIIRENLNRPVRIWRARRLFRVQFVGLLELLTLIAAIVSGSMLATAIVLFLIGIDIARYALRGRLREWISNRLVALFQTIWGLVWPEKQELNYTVRLAYSVTQQQRIT